jgi:hypothetical protein
MEKSRILISCGETTLVLAEKLSDRLRTESSEAALWCDDGRSQTSAAILEMLKDASEQFDFAVIILAKDDVKVTGTGDTLARDTYAFQAGLFMATMGRDRCFLVNTVAQSHLPSYLGGITSISFKEPADLTDPAECAKAISSVAKVLHDSISQKGAAPYQVRVPTLSVAQLWHRERPQSEGGELQPGEVIVCDTQPIPQDELAVQLRANIEHEIHYTYFLYFTVDTIEKICQALQVILVAGVASREQALDPTARMSIIDEKKDRILNDFRRICENRKLRVILLGEVPQFSFRIHNASNWERATVYARYSERYFIPWVSDASAETLWRTLHLYVADEEKPGRLFGSLKETLDLDAKKKKLFDSSLDQWLRREFPGFHRQVKQLCTGAPS